MLFYATHINEKFSNIIFYQSAEKHIKYSSLNTLQFIKFGVLFSLHWDLKVTHFPGAGY